MFKVPKVIRQAIFHHKSGTCAFCLLPATERTVPICAQCKTELPWTTGPGETVGELSAFYYESPISEYILAGKTGKQLDKLKILADLLAENLTPRIQKPPQAIIPIPLHHARLRSRGFNQAIELVRPLAHQLNIPLLNHAIARNRDTREQKTLRAVQRAANMQYAFTINQTIPYQHVALFDDVLTTGATCKTLRDQLLLNGIKTVEIWCCATTKQ
ncbi:MAG: Competence protein F homolog, phosphoribosyltransferase domain; protein YhgH required for utilization of DNA as sole source of carbon and energy [uncultured Thiotrichaceae bacterium]|uniref:Competence protein F homolog, phosphoribosyltransferase domain protein YhgH required for utilization of DNA as sole source of carbon and energy n=1 Tax=uncultured Thiotrichaceae bacterium TaxID=298394 RepID=A0A6S6SKF4_9GAMM|nr:MAG: Competence protein F homolog, phosphoribosyltransferase domain; protein YhgH required for utilization of DNA as sole source of carbon and energy [uncultured Thiotrichaceae bacterium]